MRFLLATILVVGAVLVIGTLVDGGHRDRPLREDATRTALRPVPAPRLTAREIDRQDAPDRRRQRREAAAFDRRPLLNALPVVLHGVRFEIGGLATDGRTTIIRARVAGLAHRRARDAFATLRRRTGDRSRSYRLDITR